MKKILVKKELSQENVTDMLNITPHSVALSWDFYLPSTLDKEPKSLVIISVSNPYKSSKIFNISINELCSKTKK